MKKLLLRTLGITALVLLSTLPKVEAAPGDCHVECCDGTSWHGQVSTLTACCQIFGSLCGYSGNAYRETTFGQAYCPNDGTCEGI